MLPRAVADIIRRRWTPPESDRARRYSGFFTSQLNTANESSRPVAVLGDRPLSGTSKPK